MTYSSRIFNPYLQSLKEFYKVLDKMFYEYSTFYISMLWKKSKTFNYATTFLYIEHFSRLKIIKTEKRGIYKLVTKGENWKKFDEFMRVLK